MLIIEYLLERERFFLLKRFERYCYKDIIIRCCERHKYVHE